MLFIANRLSHLGWTHFFQQQLPLDTSLRPMRVMGIQDNTWWLQDDLEVIQLAISDPDVVQGDWLLIDDTQTKVKRLDRQNHLDLGQCQLANIHALLLPDIQLKQALQGTIGEDVLVFALGADANHEQLVFSPQDPALEQHLADWLGQGQTLGVYLAPGLEHIARWGSHHLPQHQQWQRDRWLFIQGQA